MNNKRRLRETKYLKQAKNEEEKKCLLAITKRCQTTQEETNNANKHYQKNIIKCNQTLQETEHT